MTHEVNHSYILPKADRISCDVAGREFIFETGRIARQADGAVLLTCGETMIFAAATAASKPAPDADFLPLTVHHQDKFSSAGRTLAGFIKREGRPTESDVLTSRLIDRPLRPMFEDGYYNETQVLTYVWSYDAQISPEPMAICAASAALAISDIPLVKPVGAVRVAHIDGKFVVNPTVAAMETSKLDLVLAGTDEGILMIEGYCDFFTEEEVLEAIHLGHEAIKQICHAIAKWAARIGKEKDRTHLRKVPAGLREAMDAIAFKETQVAMQIGGKRAREEALSDIKAKVKAHLLPDDTVAQYNAVDVWAVFKHLQSDVLRAMLLDTKRRADGRSPTDIRPITVDQNPLPRTHGSSLFTRGETQTMAVCTLGGESSGVRYENLDGEGLRRFYLQYNFPPFSVGEAGRIGMPGRREVGHGKLAERALVSVVPSTDIFPYTIRLESNITESNGSSSMASVCGGCLAMMNAGVPIKRPVAGIAMGLVLEKDRHVVISDILGVEDALGDMDFKICGDDKITAFQMDIKVEGITPAIMKTALYQAKEGRMHILHEMLKACPHTSAELSKYAPRIETIKIHPSKIGEVIGPGGKQIRAIIEETGVQMDINDEGIVNIASNNPESMARAKAIVLGIVTEAEVGKIYKGKVTSIVDFGAFVEILPKKEGLLHISEIDHKRVAHASDYFKVGDAVEVKVLEINAGKVKLSRKALLERPAAPEKTEGASR